MALVRYRQRLGSFLALFALALQLVLSFGHHHANEFRPEPAAVAAQTGGAGDAPAAPDNDDRDCAICAVIHLAGTALAPVAPALTLPASFHDAPRAKPRPAAFASYWPRRFQARAPPQV